MKFKNSRKVFAHVSLKRFAVVGLILAVALLPFALAFSAQGVQPAETWSIQTVVSAGNVGYDTSLALDSSNNPHISFQYLTTGDLWYSWWTGSAWQVIQVDLIGDVGSDSSLALDSSNNPHISYYDGTNGDLKYAKWTDSEWSIQTVDSAEWVGGYTSLALDSSNNPHISYYDVTNGDLKYAKWTGTAWSIQTVDSAGDVGHDSSLALDSSNNPHISYYDQTNGDLKYAAAIDDFGLFVDPPSQTVAAGGSTMHFVTTTLIAGNPGPVTLSLDLPPTVGAYDFFFIITAPPFVSILSITTLNTAPAGTYNLNITATSTSGVVKHALLTLVITASPTLTLNLSPQPVARGASLTISGQLTPGQSATIRLYYRYPHQTGTWSLATTLATNAAGAYSAVATVPNSLSPGNYDLVAVWFDQATGTYAASKIVLFTIT